MTSVKVLCSNIDVMDRIEKSYSEEKACQPPHINVPLYPHQLSSLRRMKEIETGRSTGLVIDNEQIYSSYGILGERAGSGKTLTMLSHVSQMISISQLKPFNQLSISSTPSFFSLSSVETNYNTLIVSPHNIFHQWQGEIQKTNLSCTYLRSLKDIDESLGSLRETHLTLVSNTLLPSLSHILLNSKSTWERIVYDEADMIRIPSTCIPLPSKMTWLITSRYKNIINANQQVHSHVLKQLPSHYISGLTAPIQKYISETISQHPTLTIFRTASEPFFSRITKNSHPLRGYYVVKTEDYTLDISLHLPEPIYTMIQCRNAHPRLMDLIDKGCIEEAVLSINPKIITMDSLIDGLSKNCIERLQRNSCSICYDVIDVTCVTPCCTNIFCGRCIVTWITIKNSCPLCKELIQPRSLIKIDTGVRPKKLSKLDALVEYLQGIDTDNRVCEQYILFARNIQEVYTYIVNNLPNLKDKIDILHGNKTAISNLVCDFSKRSIRILCISPESVGVDLLPATHILLMDRLKGEAIERAQRIGRKIPLEVVQFCDWN
jgi:hypothetical protein